MKMIVFAIHDTKAQVFMQPFFSVNTQTGQRAFAAAVNEPDSLMHKYPQDYALFEIGEYDDVKGDIDGYTTITNLGLAAVYKEQK